ncbi:MAG: hypothetical protein J7L99_02510, partial [Planctomycetes bacterium]|nr:hypothetical protein [Planctomycetota bacterium]
VCNTIACTMAKGWVGYLRDEIRKRWAVGEVFELDDIYRLESYFSALYPRNRHVRARLRETLQILRDQGFIEFVNYHGMYRRVAE